MKMYQPLTHLDLLVDEQRLELELELNHHDGIYYSDPRYDQTVSGWKIVKNDSLYEAHDLAAALGLQTKPRYYILEPGYSIPDHIDNGTQCSINIILGIDDQAPIRYTDYGDFYYKYALIDTTKKHGVPPSANERRMLKLSIMDKSYEDVIKHLKKRGFC